MKNNLLKILAKKAKERLLGKPICNCESNVCIKVFNAEDEDFDSKVKFLFSKKEDASFNPMKILMDEKVLISLDERGREKYLLDTMDRYLKACQKFERECEL